MNLFHLQKGPNVRQGNTTVFRNLIPAGIDVFQINQNYKVTLNNNRKKKRRQNR